MHLQPTDHGGEPWEIGGVAHGTRTGGERAIGAWEKPRRWGEPASPAKDPTDWSKYTYLNGGSKATHTVPADQRAWLIREIMSKAQEDEEDKVKIPLLKTLKWNVNTLDAVISIFCGIGRRMSIHSLGKSREGVMAACVEGFYSKWPDAGERRQIMIKVADHALDEGFLMETAVEDGFEYEPEPAASPAKLAAAAPGAASASSGSGQRATRILQRNSTE